MIPWKIAPKGRDICLECPYADCVLLTQIECDLLKALPKKRSYRREKMLKMIEPRLPEYSANLQKEFKLGGGTISRWVTQGHMKAQKENNRLLILEVIL